MINNDKIVLLYVKNSVHDWLMFITQLCTYLKYIITCETFQYIYMEIRHKIKKENFSICE